MSLKAFHVVFVVVSTLFAVGFAFWGFQEYRATGNKSTLTLAFLSVAAGAALVVYGRWFLRKLKGMKCV